MKSFMTKKEFERNIFNKKHKKDNFPVFLAIPSGIGGVIAIAIFFAVVFGSKPLSEVWSEAMQELPKEGQWIGLLYLGCVGCFIANIFYSLKRYIDLDSEYKAYMSSSDNEKNDPKQVDFAENDVMIRAKFCEECGLQLRMPRGRMDTVIHVEEN